MQLQHNFSLSTQSPHTQYMHHQLRKWNMCIILSFIAKIKRQTKADRKNIFRRNKTKTPPHNELPSCQVTYTPGKYPLFILILMSCIFISQLSKGLDVYSGVDEETWMLRRPTSISFSPQSPQHAAMTSVNTFLILMASLSLASEQLNSKFHIHNHG